jgi:UDPglucose--hexose-1-phosphate uridylyltransferase
MIAPVRAARPFEVDAERHIAHHDRCSFCAGREGETEPEVYAVRAPGSRANGPGWQVRVITNRYPAVRPDAAGPASADELFAVRPGVGVHEVVIECPHHEPSLGNLPAEQVGLVFAAYRDRLAALRADPRLTYVQVFKNHGGPAGASVEHAHSQLLGVPQVPKDVRDELDAAAAYHRAHGRCVYCDLLRRERAAGERVVLETEHVAAITAYAGRFPYETWVLPKRHAGHYDRLSGHELADLADVVRAVLRRLADVADELTYNYVLHTLPLGTPDGPAFHWHLEILPRLTGIAGFELSTGWYCNPVPPEVAAARLRAGT